MRTTFFRKESSTYGPDGIPEGLPTEGTEIFSESLDVQIPVVWPRRDLNPRHLAYFREL